MNIWVALFAAVSSYFLGAISFARIAAKYFAPGDDISKTEFQVEGTDLKFQFHSISATSLAARRGPIAGCLTSILDMIKSFLPVLAFRLLYPAEYYFLIAAAANIAGHNSPIYYKFKGGRGLSPLYGGLLIIDWLSIPVTMVSGMLLGVVARNPLLAFTGGVLFLIPWLWYRFDTWPYIVFALVVNLFFWAANFSELKEMRDLKRSAPVNVGSMHYIVDAMRQGWFARKHPELDDKKEPSL